MTVDEIVKEYLVAHGYDGLCSEDCGCSVEDFPACSENPGVLDCVPARKIACSKSECATCDAECGGWYPGAHLFRPARKAGKS